MKKTSQWVDALWVFSSIFEEIVEMFWVENDLGEGLVSDALPQHGATVEGDLLVLVSPAESEDDLRAGADVLHGWGPRSDLSPQHVVEDLSGVFLALDSQYQYRDLSY